MARTLTLQAERRVEDAAEAIREWANDAIDSLYDRHGERHPLWWGDHLIGLATEFQQAAQAYYDAPKSGPKAVLAPVRTQEAP